MAVGHAGLTGSVTGTLAGVAGAGAGTAGSTEDCLVYSTAPQSPVGTQTGSQNEADGLCSVVQFPPTSPARGFQVTWCIHH